MGERRGGRTTLMNMGMMEKQNGRGSLINMGTMGTEGKRFVDEYEHVGK